MSKRRKRSSTSTKIREEKEQPPSLITSLPDDLIIDILARVPICDYPKLSLVSKNFQSLVFSPEIYTRRFLLGCTKEKETPKKKFECCFSVREAKGRNLGNNSETIFITGFDSSLPRDYIKIALGKHFGSCGQVKRVFVPIECETRARLGFAFINLTKDEEKALTLNGSDLGGRKLEVMMAKDRDERFYPFPDFKGCGNCRARATMWHNSMWFYETHGGRLMPRGFSFHKETWVNPFFKRAPISNSPWVQYLSLERKRKRLRRNKRRC